MVIDTVGEPSSAPSGPGGRRGRAGARTPGTRRRRLPVRLARGVVLLLTWPLLLAALVSMAAVADGGERSLPVVLAAALAAWLVPLLTAALVLTVLARLWRTLVATLLLLVVVVGWLRPFPHGNADASGSLTSMPQLTVMGQNLLYGQADAAPVVARIAAERPDLVVFTELTEGAVRALDAAGIAQQLPYRMVVPGYGAEGTGLYSRLPLADARPIPGLVYRAVQARVEVAGQPVTVVATHPVTPLQPGWAADYATLRTMLEPRLAAGDRIVLAGDVNATEYNGPLRRLLDAGFTDAGRARLWAWQQQTWPVGGWNALEVGPRLEDGSGWARRIAYRFGAALPPLIRIDHVLVSRGVVVESMDAADTPGSDHRGIVVRLRLG